MKNVQKVALEIGRTSNGRPFASFNYRQSNYTCFPTPEGRVEVWTNRLGLSTRSISVMIREVFAYKYSRMNYQAVLDALFSDGNRKTDNTPSL